MNREQAIKTLKTIAAKMAKKYGYTEMTIGKDTQKGIWGSEFTKFLEKESGGDCSTEITWRKPGDEYGYVEFCFRFANPVIAIKFLDKNQRETLANLEFSTKMRYIPDGVYKEEDILGIHKVGDTKFKAFEGPCELTVVMMWNPKVARPYLEEMEQMWNEMDK